MENELIKWYSIIILTLLIPNSVINLCTSSAEAYDALILAIGPKLSFPLALTAWVKKNISIAKRQIQCKGKNIILRI